jgi:glycosyltransferase involved in cell wall biosynthesis
VHRARHLAKHLPMHGWRPIVIRVDERHYAETPDPALAGLVPSSVVQVRTGAVPAPLARAFGIGDISLRAYRPLANAIASSVRAHSPSAVLITGSPFYPMLLAGWVKRQLRLPVILDFQDPWVSAEGALRPKWSKGGLAHRLAVSFEPRAVRHAAWITSVSDTQNAEMAARYPWLDRARMSAIPIGGDPDDFAAMRADPPSAPRVKLETDAFNLCYVGTFLPRAGPIVEALFKAAAQLRHTHPAIASRLRFVFVGTSNQTGATPKSSHRVAPLAAAAGIGDLVVEHPARVGYMEALSLLANADALLLLGSDEPHYTASKIYPALMSGRPFLSLFHANSSSHEILSAAGGGACLAFTQADTLDAMIPEIAEQLARVLTAPATLPPRNPAAYVDYTGPAIAARFARVLNTTAKCPADTPRGPE